MVQSESKIAIEFFSGSKTVSSVFEAKGWKSISVDIDEKLNPTICCDLLKLTKDMLPKNPSFLWFSPDCRFWSRAGNQSNWTKKTIKYRIYEHTPVTDDAKNAIALVNKVAEIINWFPGVPYVIENPIGRIHHSTALKSLGHYRYFVNYYDFGFNYSKETYLFSNFLMPFSIKKYLVVAPGLRSVNNRYQRSKVPVFLIEKIFGYVSDFIIS